MSKFAFVFPGQGSQAVGMLNGFADNKVVRDTIAEASDALQFDLWAMIADGPKESLDLTTNTQPVMLSSSVAFYRAWLAAGGKTPAVVAGHSLGEFSALVAAGVIDFKDAVKLVRFRAQAMQ
ncbi:MAG: ACP S-malonyltransferase, partial [Burkholderiaceae bacterium]|nr:ACP S-malonyltransferase [Burkholderiaceae bacterium]